MLPNPLNLPRVVCDHVLGEEHSHPHRMVCGVFVMVAGVSLAKTGHAIDSVAWLITADVLGYSLHGLGFAPYVEYLLSRNAAHHQQPPTND